MTTTERAPAYKTKAEREFCQWIAESASDPTSSAANVALIIRETSTDIGAEPYKMAYEVIQFLMRYAALSAPVELVLHLTATIRAIVAEFDLQLDNPLSSLAHCSLTVGGAA